MHSGFLINSGKPTKNDIMVHMQSVLMKRCKENARLLSVDRNNTINPILFFCFGSKLFGRFKSGPEEKDTIRMGET